MTQADPVMGVRSRVRNRARSPLPLSCPAPALTARRAAP
jgi:hypothetical protein